MSDRSHRFVLRVAVIEPRPARPAFDDGATRVPVAQRCCCSSVARGGCRVRVGTHKRERALHTAVAPAVSFRAVASCCRPLHPLDAGTSVVLLWCGVVVSAWLLSLCPACRPPPLLPISELTLIRGNGIVFALH